MFKVSGIIHDIEESIKKKKGRIELEISGKRIPIIADEDVNFKSGEVKTVKIEPIDIPSCTVTIIDGYEKHPIGVTVSIGEEISSPFDSERKGKHGVFIAFKDGQVKKGDVIGGVFLIHLHRE
ncbi:DUF22 domain-containing protein [Methanofervidicoccus sp. A16]|uniref:DUF22 domain-containing protein n=1 Tax=Methanofervidicoccus sp. A16 TaxID=2607662 RepID=UPI00118C763B|nr:DUF22 domain-containing protein [Methanofervidicoccus sp. A16]AXI25265.1 DUF22 domain-containing protein [Methanofervidicoccus sp. A16]